MCCRLAATSTPPPLRPQTPANRVVVDVVVVGRSLPSLLLFCSLASEGAICGRTAASSSATPAQRFHRWLTFFCLQQKRQNKIPVVFLVMKKKCTESARPSFQLNRVESKRGIVCKTPAEKKRRGEGRKERDENNQSYFEKLRVEFLIALHKIEKKWKRKSIFLLERYKNNSGVAANPHLVDCISNCQQQTNTKTTPHTRRTNNMGGGREAFPQTHRCSNSGVKTKNDKKKTFCPTNAQHRRHR